MQRNYSNKEERITYELERGSAEIRVQLKNGFIRVYHCEDGSLLHERPARLGDWAELWTELSRADRDGVSVLGRVEISKKLGLEVLKYAIYGAGLILGFKFIIFLIYVFN
jgi:hypothetical protein